MRFVVKNEFDRFVAQLEIDAVDLVNAELDPMDRELVRECEQSGSISDKLLALETIARRIEENYTKEGRQQ